MQLALGSAKDEINESFCHELYELKRSPFPVLFEVASHIVCYDSRVSYFTEKRPVRFRANFILERLKKEITLAGEEITCSISHPTRIMEFQKNTVPFCCSYCSSFL